MSPRSVALILVGAILIGCSEPAPREITTENGIVFAAVGQRELRLDLCTPAGDGPFPLIVCIHGGGWQSGNRHAFSEATRWLARQGYAAVTVDYRLAPRHRFPAPIEDVKAAVRFMRANAARYNIDPDRIGVWGRSAGGHLATMVGLTDKEDGLEGEGGSADRSSRVQAVVNFFGGFDVRTLKLSSAGEAELREGFGGKGLDGLVRDLLGTADRTDPIMKRAAAATYADTDDPPVLSVHGTDDVLVPIAEARSFNQALKDAGVDSSLVELSDAGHGFAGRHQREARKVLLEFFDRHLRK